MHTQPRCCIMMFIVKNNAVVWLDSNSWLCYITDDRNRLTGLLSIPFMHQFIQECDIQYHHFVGRKTFSAYTPLEFEGEKHFSKLDYEDQSATNKIVKYSSYSIWRFIFKNSHLISEKMSQVFLQWCLINALKHFLKNISSLKK